MKIGLDARHAFHHPIGLGNYSRTLMTSLLKQHPENEYILLDKGNPQELPYFTRQLNESGAVWSYKAGGILGKWSHLYGWGRTCRANNIDLFHGLRNEMPMDWQPGKTRAVVTIDHLRFKHFPESYSALERWVCHKKMAYVARNAKVIIATCQQTKADLERWYPSSFGKIEVVYQDTDPGFHYRKRPEAVAKVLYKFDLVERPYILYVGKLEHGKNHQILLDAFTSVLHQIPDDLVLVGGRGDAADAVLDRLGEFEGRLRWLGQVEADDLINLYDGCAFTVYPSVFEGFANPLLESMRRGKAILSSAGSCFEEIAGKAAIYANPQVAAEFSEGMVALSTEMETRRKHEQAALTECKRFDSKTLVEQLFQAYKKALDR